MPDGLGGASALAVCALLLAPGLSGCLSGEPSQPGASGTDGGADLVVPRPAEGSWFNYSGDRRTLNVTVGPVEERTDTWMRERPARVMNLTLWKGEGRTYHFETAVDPWTGRTVAQWAECGTWDDVNDCRASRDLWIGSAHGLPSALGAGPLWGEPLDAGTINRSLPTPLPEPSHWKMELQPARDEACLDVEPVEDPSTEWLAALRFDGGLGPFTVCEEVGLPVRFESYGGKQFRLDAFQMHKAPPPGEQPSLAEPEPVVDLVERSAPVLVETPELDSFLPETEAHEAALERSEAYARLFENGAQAAVIESFLAYEGSSRGSLGSYSSQTWSQRLVAVDTDGARVTVQIEKTVRETATGERRVSYDVVEETSGSKETPFPTADSWAPRQASVVDAISLVENLTEQPWDDLYWKNHHGSPAAWMTDWDNGRVRGPTLIAFSEDAQAGESDRSLVIQTPNMLTVDGPTGALLSLDGPEEAIEPKLR